MPPATIHSSSPLLVSELPATTVPQGAPSMFRTWTASRRALRQRRAFDRALATVDPRMAAELLSAARHDS